MRCNDKSPHPRYWTNAKLMRGARKYANLESFSVGLYNGEEAAFKPGWKGQTGSPDVADFCREQTRLYRDSWLQPILDEIEKRFVKKR